LRERQEHNTITEQIFDKEVGMGELRSAVDALAACIPAELDDAALGGLITELSVQEDRLAGIRHRLVAEHDRRQVWKAEGFSSEKQWLRDRCRLSPGEASVRAETARRLRALPRTGEALVSGSIGSGHARAAVTAVRDLPADAAPGLDRLVAAEGPDLDPARLRTAVDGYAQRVDGESLVAREERAWQARRLNVTRTADGGIAVDGRLDRVGGETVLTALAGLATPDGERNLRSGEQRRADALVALAQRQLDGGDLPATAAVRPHVTVVVDLATLQQHEGAGPAHLDRLGSLSAAAARQLACDAGATRVLTGPAGMPLDVGRSSRVVTLAQRRALAARDRGCVGCRAPAGWCQAHHVQHWADGRPTDLDNLLLVCHACHRDIHLRGWYPARAPDGHWTLRSPPQGALR
jgi:hypothetical protein